MLVRRTSEKNDGPEFAQAPVDGHIWSSGTSGQFAAFVESIGSHVPDTQRSPGVNTTVSGIVPYACWSVNP